MTRHALTSRRSRKGIFHLPVPLGTRAAGVPLGGGARSQAWRPWNPRARGIPVPPGDPAPVVLWEVPGWGWPRQEWTPEVQHRTRTCVRNCAGKDTVQSPPWRKEWGSLRHLTQPPGSGLGPSLCTPTLKISDLSLNPQHSRDADVQNPDRSSSASSLKRRDPPPHPQLSRPI